MKTTLSVIALSMLSGCTFAFSPMPDIPSGYFDGCETQDCIIDRLDAAPPELKRCNKMAWMEGYRVPKLRELQKMGKLTIKEVSPVILVPIVLVGLPPPGMTTFRWGLEYGDLMDAEVYYLQGQQWILIHELEHVAGICAESGGDFGLLYQDYTPNQQRIMDAENVNHWYETSYYKNEDKTWHDR